LLSYTKSTTNNVVPAAPIIADVVQNDVFDVIDRVQLYSGSSLVSTLTKYDLMSQWSDLTADELNTIQESCLKRRTIPVLAAGAVSNQEFTIPLVFGFFNNVNTQLNTSFLEVLSVKVIWANALVASPALGTTTIGSVKLVGRYKNYMNDDNTQILAENFGKNSTLNMLSNKFYDENQSDVVTVAANATSSVTVELKSTDVVTSFYLVLMKVGGVTPQKVSGVTMIGSGDTILDLNYNELQYMRLLTNGSARTVDPVSSLNQLPNVVKIQTGLDTEATWSNGYSLREINAPLMTVNFTADAAGGDYYLKVVEDTSCIYEVISATGKLSLSLVN